MIPVASYHAEFLCAGAWTECIVLGIADDEHSPMFLIAFEDDEGCESLLRVSRVRRVDG